MKGFQYKGITVHDNFSEKLQVLFNSTLLIQN